MLRENPLERVNSNDIREEIQLLTKPYCREPKSKKKSNFKIFYRFMWNHRLNFIILFCFIVFYLNFISILISYFH